jgi:hypothetical protein
MACGGIERKAANSIRAPIERTSVVAGWTEGGDGTAVIWPESIASTRFHVPGATGDVSPGTCRRFVAVGWLQLIGVGHTEERAGWTEKAMMRSPDCGIQWFSLVLSLLRLHVRFGKGSLPKSIHLVRRDSERLRH